MKKNLKLILLMSVLLSAFACSTPSKTAVENTKTTPKMEYVLFVVTSHTELGTTGKKTGAYISEIAHPYEILTEAGYSIDFVSPKGGQTPLDGMDAIDDRSTALLKDEAFLKKLHNAAKPEDIYAGKYAAIFYAGGHGTMFDLPDNAPLQKIAATIYESNGVVAAVCHGPSALVNIKLSDGTYLVNGKEVAAFTNKEEAAAELTDQMPFLLESKLIERGAKHSAAENFQPHVIVSGRLITGQNPASADLVGQKLVEMLKSSPAE